MLILLIHAAATWYLVGLIWFVQVVHYPLFGKVAGQRVVRMVVAADGSEREDQAPPLDRDTAEAEADLAFVPYNEAHMWLTSWVVAPPMVVELATAMWLIFDAPPAVPQWVAAVGLALVAVIWLSTALLQVPRHRELAAGYLARPHRRLVLTNWLRTAMWSVRGVLVLWMVGVA